MHSIHTSISHTIHFDKQEEMSEYLGIVGTSKKAISTRCRSFSFGCTFYDYYGEYNIEI
jgi:hypothetical protein